MTSLWYKPGRYREFHCVLDPKSTYSACGKLGAKHCRSRKAHKSPPLQDRCPACVEVLNGNE